MQSTDCCHVVESWMTSPISPQDTLSIGDYKHPLQKGLIYCSYLFGSENCQFLAFAD